MSAIAAYPTIAGGKLVLVFIPAVIGAVGAIAGAVISAVIGRHVTKRVEAVHVLVNSRLDNALENIKTLKAKINDLEEKAVESK